MSTYVCTMYPPLSVSVSLSLSVCLPLSLLTTAMVSDEFLSLTDVPNEKNAPFPYLFDNSKSLEFNAQAEAEPIKMYTGRLHYTQTEAIIQVNVCYDI